MTYDQLVEAIQMTTNVNDLATLCDKNGLIFGNFEQQSRQFRELANIYRGLHQKHVKLSESRKLQKRTVSA